MGRHHATGRVLEFEALGQRRPMAADLGSFAPSESEVASINSMDVNGDGNLNAEDAGEIVSYLTSPNRAGTSINQEQYDINMDGYVSPIDALLIINHLGKLRGELTGVGVSQGAWDEDTSLGFEVSTAMTVSHAQLIVDHLLVHGVSAASDETENLDVNQDGILSAADALIVINQLDGEVNDSRQMAFDHVDQVLLSTDVGDGLADKMVEVN